MNEIRVYWYRKMWKCMGNLKKPGYKNGVCNLRLFAQVLILNT